MVPTLVENSKFFRVLVDKVTTDVKHPAASFAIVMVNNLWLLWLQKNRGRKYRLIVFFSLLPDGEKSQILSSLKQYTDCTMNIPQWWRIGL